MADRPGNYSVELVVTDDTGRASDAGSLVVRIRVWVNPDGTVAQARILDASRMATDVFFRAAAETALRAVLNPRCSPLPIPPKKYDQFKVLILHFNPKQATGP